jgi:hypothetical protein
MRIVIDIDPTGTGGTEAPHSTAVINLADFEPGTLGAGPMSDDAGVAGAPALTGDAELPADLLARATALNAQNAGPAPGFSVPSPIRTAVTQADSSSVVSVLDDETAALSPCSLPTMQEGCVTNGGPAPK